MRYLYLREVRLRKSIVIIATRDEGIVVAHKAQKNLVCIIALMSVV